MPVQNCNLNHNQLSLEEYSLVRNRAALITLLAGIALGALLPIASRSPYFLQSLAGKTIIYSLSTLSNLALITLLTTTIKIYSTTLQLKQQKKELQQKEEAPPCYGIDQQDGPLVAELEAAPPPYPLQQQDVPGVAPALEAAPPPQPPILPELNLYPEDKNLNDIARALTLIKNQLAPFLERLNGDKETRNLFMGLMDHIIADLPHSAHLKRQQKEGVIRKERKELQTKQDELQKKLQQNHNSLLHNAERLLPEQLQNKENLRERQGILRERQRLLTQREALLGEEKSLRGRQEQVEAEQGSLQKEKDELPIKLQQIEVQLQENQQKMESGELVKALSCAEEHQGDAVFLEREKLLLDKLSLTERQKVVERELPILQREGAILQLKLSHVEEQLKNNNVLVQKQLQDERDFVVAADRQIQNKIGLVGLAGAPQFALRDRERMKLKNIERIQIEITRVAKSTSTLQKRIALIEKADELQEKIRQLDERGNLLREGPQEPIAFPNLDECLNDWLALLQRVPVASDLNIYTQNIQGMTSAIQRKSIVKRDAAELPENAVPNAVAEPARPIPLPQPPLDGPPHNHFVYLAQIFHLSTLLIPIGTQDIQNQLAEMAAAPLASGEGASSALLKSPNVAKKTALDVAFNKGLASAAVEFPNGLRSPSDPNFDYIKNGVEFARKIAYNGIDRYLNVTTWRGWMPIPGFGVSTERVFHDMDLLVPILKKLSETALTLSQQQEPYTQEQIIGGFVRTAVMPLNERLWR